MSNNGMTDIELLVELQAIHQLKARRDHAVDQKDWDDLRRVAHRRLRRHVDLRQADRRRTSGGRSTLGSTGKCHNRASRHTPVIDFQDRNNATGVWAMEDNLSGCETVKSSGCAGFGFYHETYVRGRGWPMALQLSQTRTHPCRDVARSFGHGGGFLR